MDMDGYYESNLHHMAEPASPSERDTAVSTTLEDYQALYLGTILREWAAYHADSDDQREIARGYAEYIDRQVRSNEQNGIELYAHTREAAETLMDAMEDWHTVYHDQNSHHDNLFDTINECIGFLWCRHDHEQVNRNFPQATFDAPPEDIDVEGVDHAVEYANEGRGE